MKKVLLAVCLSMTAVSAVAEKHVLQGSVYLQNIDAQSRIQMTVPYSHEYEDLTSCNKAIGIIMQSKPSMTQSLEVKYGTFEKVGFLSCTSIWQ